MFFFILCPQFLILSTAGRADVSYSTTATLDAMLLDVVTVLQLSFNKRNSLTLTHLREIFTKEICVSETHCQMTQVVGVDEGVNRDR